MVFILFKIDKRQTKRTSDKLVFIVEGNLIFCVILRNTTKWTFEKKNLLKVVVLLSSKCSKNMFQQKVLNCKSILMKTSEIVIFPQSLKTIVFTLIFIFLF